VNALIYYNKHIFVFNYSVFYNVPQFSTWKHNVPNQLADDAVWSIAERRSIGSAGFGLLNLIFNSNTDFALSLFCSVFQSAISLNISAQFNGGTLIKTGRGFTFSARYRWSQIWVYRTTALYRCKPLISFIKKHLSLNIVLSALIALLSLLLYF